MDGYSSVCDMLIVFLDDIDVSERSTALSLSIFQSIKISECKAGIPKVDLV